MKRFGSLMACPVLSLAVVAISGCGNGRQLQSVIVSPASADAKNYAHGQVPFTATGSFSKAPSPVVLTSTDVLWCVGQPGSNANPAAGVCSGNINPGATVDQNGVAQCTPTFTGTATILSGKAAPGMGNPDGGDQLTIFGSATLTCP
jgi:hypothetical protein